MKNNRWDKKKMFLQKIKFEIKSDGTELVREVKIVLKKKKERWKLLLLLPHGHGLLMMIEMNNKNIYSKILQFITLLCKKLFLSPAAGAGEREIFFFFFLHHSLHGLDGSQSYDMDLTYLWEACFIEWTNKIILLWFEIR